MFSSIVECKSLETTILREKKARDNERRDKRLKGEEFLVLTFHEIQEY